MASSKVWYFSHQGQIHGPFTSEQLKREAAEGRLEAGDLVQQQGMTKWVMAKSVKGLFPAETAPPAVSDVRVPFAAAPALAAPALPIELTPVPARIADKVRAFAKTVPTLHSGKWWRETLLNCGIGLFLAGPVICWILIWLGGQADFGEGLFGGLCGGLCGGFVVAVIMAGIGEVFEWSWKSHCTLAGETLFRETFPPHSADFRLALRSLLERESKDETRIVRAVVEKLQYTRSGPVPPAGHRPPPGASERIKALVLEMQPPLNRLHAREAVRLGYDSGDPAFKADRLPLPAGETAICTIDLTASREEENGTAALVVTPSRFLFCPNWAAEPIAWAEIAFDRAARLDSKEDTRVLLIQHDDTAVLWPGPAKEYGPLLLRFLAAAGAPAFRGPGETPDLADLKKGIAEQCDTRDGLAEERKARELAANGRVRCPACRSATIEFVKGATLMEREAMSWTGAIAGGLLFGGVGAFVGSMAGRGNVDRYRCKDCAHEFPLGGGADITDEKTAENKDEPAL